MFVDTAVLRTEPRATRTVADYLAEVRGRLLELLDQADHPFEELVARLGWPRDPRRHPVFDTMFVVQRFALDSLALEGLTVRPLELDLPTARFDQTWFATPSGDEIRVQIEYRTDLFAARTIQALAESYLVVLQALGGDPGRLLGELPVVGPRQRRWLLDEVNPRVDFVGAPATVSEGFARVAARQPAQVALDAPGGTWSYGELATGAARVARFLAARGGGPGTIVGLLAARSGELVAGLLGILQAGAAVLPLHPDHPRAYREQILADSGASLVLKYLSDAEDRDLLASSGEFVDLAAVLRAEELAGPPVVGPGPGDLAYVCYTSGTTGRPKGIGVDHRTLLNLLEHQRRHTTIDHGRVLQFAASTFDVAFQEIGGCLLAGGRLLLVPEAERLDLPRLCARLAAAEVRTVFWPPALLQVVFGEAELAARFPACVRHVVAAGEQLVIPPLLRQRIAAGTLALHNHYGPAETHVVTMHTIDRQTLGDDRPPIGRPIANRSVYLLDAQDGLVPPGAPGELCVGGALTRPCYLGAPGPETARAFAADPFVPGGWLYRTGDLARWRGDGTLEFLGRRDAQVKIRGHRVEPAAVEAVLLEVPGVRAARVVALPDGLGQQLVAYYVAAPDPGAAALRARLALHLPAPLIPAHFVPLPDLPVTVHGKLDCRRLPRPGSRVAPAGEAPPAAPLLASEAFLAAIWQEVLGVDAVGPDDDFFARGGHSLTVLQVLAQIAQRLQVALTPAQLFQARTLREQAALVAAAGPSGLPPLAPAPVRPTYPASAAQRRLFLIQQLDPASTAYNMPLAWAVEGPFDPTRLTAALAQVVRRHEILRTDFRLVDGEVRQRIHPTLEVGPELVESPGRDVPLAVWTRDFVRPFDLGRAPLWRVRLVRQGPARWLLLFDAHHVLLDGRSLALLVGDLSRALGGGMLDPPPRPFKDFAEWQHLPEVRAAQLAAGDYWLAQHTPPAPPLRLPRDRPRGASPSFAGRVLRARLDPGLGELCAAAEARHGLSLNMLGLAAYALLLAKSSGQADLVVGLPVSGRPHAALQDTLGMFVDTLALRLRPAAGQTVATYLQDVRTTLLQALDHADYPFDELVARLGLPRDPARPPLFDTLFATQDFGGYELSCPGLRIRALAPDTTTARLALTWLVAPRPDGLQLQIEYGTALFDEGTIRGLVAGFEALLRALATQPERRLGELAASVGSPGAASVGPPGASPAAPVESPAASSSRAPARPRPRVWPWPRRPRGDTAAALLPIWREVLRDDALGPDTDFFDAGGRSLEAIQLVSRIRQACGVDLPGSVVFRYPTVRQLAALLDAGAAGHPAGSLVDVRAAGDRGRLFCVHPAPGTVLCYHELARHLPAGWAIHALQARGLVRGQTPHRTVEEMAADYVLEITRVQPHGPYLLLGWSTGGKVAHEVARQLEAQGEPVALLVLVDTDPVFLPVSGRDFSPIPLFVYSLKAMFTHGPVVRHHLDVASWWPPDLVRRLRMWHAQVGAVLRYRPLPAAVRARVVLFQTAACRRRDEELDDPARSVQRIVPQVEIVPIVGDHLDLFRSPWIEPWCRELARRLDEVLDTEV